MCRGGPPRPLPVGDPAGLGAVSRAAAPCLLPDFAFVLYTSHIMQLLTGLKGIQLLPNGLGGSMMALDFIHGMVRRDFEEK